VGGTEDRHPETVDLDRRDALGICQLMHREDQRAVAAVGAVLPDVARAAEAVARALAAGRRLFYVGAGTSGRLGVLDASELPPTFGVRPETACAVIAGGPAAVVRSVEGAEDDAAQGAADLRLHGIGPGDVCIGLAASGRTPYVLGAVAEARRLGACTVGVLCNPGAPLAAAVDIPIVVATGPEVLLGSTRLKAGTAQKLVLNMISTAAMVLTGHVYENLMVDVVASNAKLRARAVRMVTLATGLAAERAEELLGQSGGEVKTAIVMALAGVDAAEARRRLRAAGGFVRGALA
jgi:N-acetylmuramic acid 6-phosphate etherase